MSKSEMEEITQKTIAQGGILANLYFDMQNEKEDALQPLLTELINEKLLKSTGVVYCFGSIEAPIKIEHLYSTTSVVTVLFKDLGGMISVIFNFAPAAIELLKPEGEFRLRTADLQSVLIQLSQVSMDYSEFILKKVLKPEDIESIKHNIKMREEIGKRLLEKKDDKEQGVKPPST